MLLRNLTKVYVSEYEEINDHGEIEKVWTYKGIAYLNLQQDVNELDRKSTGEVDYSILKGRTDKMYDISNGNGISTVDISQKEKFLPDYIIKDSIKIGNTATYRMEKVNEV